MDHVALEELKTKSKRLGARATSLKMALHDLAEELPTGWEKIPEVATAAFEAYKALDEVRKRIVSASD